MAKPSKTKWLRRTPKSFRFRVLEALTTDVESRIPSDLRNDIDDLLRRRSPDRIKALGDKWGLQSIPHLETGTHCLATVNQLSRLLTKYTSSGDDERLHTEAINRFAETDASLTGNTFRKADVENLRRITASILGRCPGITEVSRYAKHGKGASRCHPYQERFQFYKLSQFPYECSPGAIPSMSQLILEDERWRDAVDLHYRAKHKIPIWCPVTDSSLIQGVCQPVKNNIVTTVPKDSSKRRTIAKEPAFSMYLQLAIHYWIAKRLRYVTDVDFSDVSRNRESSRIGSMITGRYSPCTIDLSEASDRLSLDVVQTLLPYDWLELCLSCRSEYSELPKRSILLKKYASMGNGTTFAMQTVIYYALCVYAFELAREPFDKKAVYVFGDDIIVPYAVVPHLYRLLDMAGLKVNYEKSFINGPIRETCGREHYKGQDIRPVFYRKDTVDLQEYLAFRNQLWLWLDRHGYEPVETFVINYLDSFITKVPEVPATLDLSSGRFCCLKGPLYEGAEYTALSYSAKPRKYNQWQARGTGFNFMKLAATLRPTDVKLYDDTSTGSVFTNGNGRTRVQKTRRRYRYHSDTQWR